MSPSKKSFLFPFLLLGLLLVSHELILSRANFYQVVDDAYIGFRYSRNFARGHGLVYNLGERVEGYTNFLWVVLLSLFSRAGMDIPKTSIVLGMGLSLLCLLYTLRLSKSLSSFSAPWNSLCGLMLIADGSFAFWAVSGMETLMFTALLVMGTSFFLQEEVWGERGHHFSAIVFALATLTRPEGGLFAMTALLWLSLNAWGKRDRASLAKLFSWAFLFFLIFIPYFLWRWAYYGYLLPNPFYVKVGFGWLQFQRGLLYTYDFCLKRGGLVLFALLCLPLRPRNEALSFLTLMSLLYAAYVVYVGGDWAGAFRFFVPIVPFLYILVQEGLLGFLERLKGFLPLGSRAFQAALFAALFLGLVGISSYEGEFKRFILPYRYVELERASLGRYLKERAPKNSLMACWTAGSLPFYSELTTIDMYGLTDLHIAHKKVEDMGRGQAGHEKFDIAYILARRPHFIVIQGYKDYLHESNYMPWPSMPSVKYHTIYRRIDFHPSGERL